MNYTSRYNLEFNPFIKNSKETLIETDEYKDWAKVRTNFVAKLRTIGRYDYDKLYREKDTPYKVRCEKALKYIEEKRS